MMGLDAVLEHWLTPDFSVAVLPPFNKNFCAAYRLWYCLTNGIGHIITIVPVNAVKVTALKLKTSNRGFTCQRESWAMMHCSSGLRIKEDAQHAPISRHMGVFVFHLYIPTSNLTCNLVFKSEKKPDQLPQHLKIRAFVHTQPPCTIFFILLLIFVHTIFLLILD